MDYFTESLSAALHLIVALDAEVYLVVWTSTMISLAAVAIAALLGLPLGVVTAIYEFPGKRLFLQLLNTLMAIPTVVVGLFLYGILSRQGPLGELGLLYTPTAIVIGECFLIAPIIWNLSISAAVNTDPRLAATCDAFGATWWQRVMTYAHEARQGLVAAVVIGFGRAIGEVGIAMMLGGNIEGFTRTMTTAIALETSKGEFELALALGILLLCIAFTINIILQRINTASK